MSQPLQSLAFLFAVVPAISFAAGPTPAAVDARADTVETEDRPVRQVRTGEAGWFADFGVATFGWLRVSLPEPVAADTRLIVSLGEKKAATDAVDAAPGGSVRFQKLEVTVPARTTSVEVVPAWQPKYAAWIGMPAGSHEVMPFRYVEIAGLPADAGEPRIERVSRHVPFDEAASSFSCSDPALEEVWRLCKHSIKATSFLGLYVDGDRERIPYEADAYINQLCHYGVDAHYTTGRLSHEHFLKNPTWPTEWRQHTPLMAWADWLYSGDDASMRRHYDAIRGRVMLDRRRDDGLFIGQNAGTPRDIVDWPEKERDGYDMRHAVKTVTSAFHARSLQAMAAIARAMGREHDAEEYAALHAATTRAINEKLFDAARGVYVDGLDAATGKRSGHASLHANMLPLAFGLVPADRVAAVADFVESRGMACSVYGAQYLLDGLFDAGRERHALALLTATHDRGWLHMSRDVGSTITLEAWDAKYKPNLDWNHAWGAVPANVIPRKLMGIEPIEPGFRQIRVRPRTATLERAAIRHPSPRGPIDLEVTQSADDWRATLGLPEGVVAEVHVPTAERGRVTVVRGGQQASADVLRIDDGCCVIEATPGTTVISVTAPTPAR
jgi:hypothetical protein